MNIADYIEAGVILIVSVRFKSSTLAARIFLHTDRYLSSVCVRLCINMHTYKEILVRIRGRNIMLLFEI